MNDPHAFDPDFARAGEQVQFCKTGGAWIDVHYVGPDRVRGGHFVQFYDGSTISTSALRMKPRPIKKWSLEFDDPKRALAASEALIGDGWDSVPDIKEVEYPPAP